ncbi:MAG: aldose 1-epimerase [Planctomycetaceae bacterium]
MSRNESIVLTDPSSGSRAEIAPHLGFNCYAFRAIVDGEPIEVIDAEENFAAGQSRPSGHGIPILFPFPNRIRGGRFKWFGRSYKLPESLVGHDGNGNAIHGFCLDRPWRVTAQRGHFVVGEFQLSRDAPERMSCWPSDCLVEVRYELRGPVLRADVRIANTGSETLPWGFGTHPYFRLPLSPRSHPSRCLIEASAAEEWELVNCLPTGGRCPITEAKDLRDGAYFDTLSLDDVLTGLKAEPDAVNHVIIDEQAGLQVMQRCDTAFRELVVYTPRGRNAVCLEPYTCATDAINLEAQGIDAGLRTLDPGSEFHTWIEIRAGQVLA